MSSRKVKNACAVIASFAAAAALSIPVFAYSTTWNTALKPFRNASDLASGTHATANRNMYASVRGMGGDYRSMYMLTRQYSGGWSDVSASKVFYVGAGQNIYFNTSVPSGRQLMLVGGNEKVSAVHVDANGYADFN